MLGRENRRTKMVLFLAALEIIVAAAFVFIESEGRASMLRMEWENNAAD